MFLHVDLDCFFISAARTRESALNGVPAAVVSGGKIDIFGNLRKDAIILSASYEARALGVKTAMPLFMALKFAPKLAVRYSDFALYKELSNRLKSLLYSYTNEIEKFSIDEFFMDLAGTRYDENPLEFAKMLQKRILDELALPCSVGLAPKKYMAKFATNLAKPAGVRLISNLNEIAGLEIAAFPGVGKSTAKKLAERGIIKFEDLKFGETAFAGLGKYGRDLFARLMMRDEDKIERERERKSLSMARTFTPLVEREKIEARILTLCRHVSLELFKKSLTPHRYELKFRYKGAGAKSVSVTLCEGFTQKLLERTMLELFAAHDERGEAAINYLSVGVGEFGERSSLFAPDEKEVRLGDALSKIRLKYGANAIRSVKDEDDEEMVEVLSI